MIKIILIIAAFASSCAGHSTESKARERELELRERELDNREQELKEKEADLEGNTTQRREVTYHPVIPKLELPIKYVFVSFKVKHPKYMEMPQTLEDDYGRKQHLGYFELESMTYRSEISEVLEYDEDKEYQLMDRRQRELEVKLREQDNVNSQFVSISNSTRSEHLKILPAPPAEIAEREAKVYDTYKDASIAREGANKEN